MNWLTKGKIGLAILPAFLFFSCDNDELLSLDFNPQDESIDLSYTELTLPYQLVQLDSVTTSYPGIMLVGNYQNADFGQVRAKSYMGMVINSKEDADPDDRLDSLVFYINRSYYYGSSSPTASQTIRLYRLAEEIQDTVRYYNTSSLAFDPTLLGQLSYSFVPEVGDTLSMRLNERLGNELLSLLKANAPEIDSSGLFRGYFNGLVLEAESDGDFMAGYNPGSARLSMFYSAPGDTVSKTFNLRIAAVPLSRTNTGPLAFNGIEYDRSGTALAGISEPGKIGSPTDDQVYLQSSTGLVPRIDFQPLEDFVTNSTDRILLNSVTLHIGLPEPEQGKGPPVAIAGNLIQDDGISLIFTDDGRENFFSGMYGDSEYIYNELARQPVPRPPSPLLYDSASMSYDLRVTSFTQTLLDGFVENSEVLLYPNDLNSSVTQMVTHADSLKLRVYYTRLR